MAIPAGETMDAFQIALENARRGVERTPSFHPSGRPRQDKERGHQTMLYLRTDVEEFLRELVELGFFTSMSKAANAAIRFYKDAHDKAAK